LRLLKIISGYIRRAIEVFKNELSAYKGAKGTVQFPLDEPLPLELVRRIVEFRVAENMKKAGAKKGKSAKKVTSNGDFLATLSAPARRALETNGITTVERLAEYSEKEILALHGVGKASLPAFRAALDGAGLGFKE
jgi:DNA-directed RNA polymerase alpha subunit